MLKQLKTKNGFSYREPIWGWRDDTVSIMERQIDLASRNGIDCFVFCWYWKDDKKQINREAIDSLCYNTSINLFLKAKNRWKMKFCVLICNHTGFEIEGKQNWMDAIEYLDDHFFHDSQYLRINNKPVVAFYQPNKVKTYMADIAELAENKCKLNGLFTIAINSFSHQFDANTWYAMLQPETGSKRDYKDLTDFAEKHWYHKDVFNVFPLVMSGWDRRPINPTGSDYYVGRTPTQFENHLDNAFKCLKEAQLKHNLIFIYAWNELGEGGYIVPTKERHSSQYLKRIKKVKHKWRHKF